MIIGKNNLMDEKEKPYTPSCKGHYAGFVSRLFAYVIDLLIPLALFTFIFWLISATLDMLNVREVAASLGFHFGGGVIFDENGQFIARGMLLIVSAWLYNAVFLSLTNRTIGKAIMGLQVVPLDGGRIGFVRATIRYFGYILSTLPLFLGFFWILASRQRQGWHDKLARTYVVYTWDARPDEVFLRHSLEKLHTANKKRYGSLPDTADEND